MTHTLLPRLLYWLCGVLVGLTVLPWLLPLPRAPVAAIVPQAESVPACLGQAILLKL